MRRPASPQTVCHERVMPASVSLSIHHLTVPHWLTVMGITSYVQCLVVILQNSNNCELFYCGAVLRETDWTGRPQSGHRAGPASPRPAPVHRTTTVYCSSLARLTRKHSSLTAQSFNCPHQFCPFFAVLAVLNNFTSCSSKYLLFPTFI